jgi:tryptophan 2,3-dioxygenase
MREMRRISMTIPKAPANKPSNSTSQTPYSAYLQTDTLHSLQKPVSKHPTEMAFLINAQVMELYWALIVYELQAAQISLRADDLAESNRALYRTVTHFQALNGTWRSLSWMTPSDLMPILTALSATHGRDTALQGWTYRHMAFLLGIKQREQLEHFKPQPQRLQQLSKALAEPSVYDEVLSFLHRQGFSVPKSHLERDLTESYIASPEIDLVWREVYADPTKDKELKALGELLADIAEEFTTWKYRHLMSTRRTLGGRPAYHGVSGVAWLVPTLDEIPFPELWTARTTIGDPPPVCPHKGS